MYARPTYPTDEKLPAEQHCRVLINALGQEPLPSARGIAQCKVAALLPDYTDSDDVACATWVAARIYNRLDFELVLSHKLEPRHLLEILSELLDAYSSK